MAESTFNEQEFSERLIRVIEANLQNEQFGVTQLAHEMGMSRSNLHRKIKPETGKSASQFISQVRLRYALELLQNSERTVSEVAYECGFHSVTYFSTCFHDFYGYSPRQASTRGHLPDEKKEKTSENSVNSSESKKRLVRFSSLVILSVLSTVLLLVFYVEPFHSHENSPVEISVLPVELEPFASSGQPLVYAVMFQLIKNLSEIENFEVRLAKNNTEFSNKIFLSSEAGKNENADYIIESKVNSSDEIEISLKKVENEEYELSESFLLTNDIFYPAAQMAFKIATSINQGLSNEEKAGFETAPTNNHNALLKYQLGLSYKSISEQGKHSEKLQNLLKSKRLFEEAIKNDSVFTEAYIELGEVYIDNIYFSAETMEQADQNLESGHKLVQKALELDKENREALKLLARYYLRKGMNEKANRILARLSHNKKMSCEHFMHEFDVFVHYEDYYNALQNFFYYLKEKPDDELIPKYMLYNVAIMMSDAGFPKIGWEYARKLLDDYSDSLLFYQLMAIVEMRAGSCRNAIEWYHKTSKERAFNKFSYHFLMFNYAVLGDSVNAAENLKKWEAAESSEIRYPYQYYISGYVYRWIGLEEKAIAYFKIAEKKLNEAVSLNTPRSQTYIEQFYLAGVYFELGETEKAIQFLSMLNERKTIPHWIILGFEDWPALSKRRNIPEIEKIYQSILSIYNREHNRIANLLMKEGANDRIAQTTVHPL